jgi:hypothetical protein
VEAPRDPKLNITNSAPVGSVDLDASNEDGTPAQIWPCHECYPWHVEVIVEDGNAFVREWHAIDCPTFKELISDR